jgi:dTDP-glucose 4,6-dehydratase
VKLASVCVNLLVTGGAGFIGSNFVSYWAARHPGDRIVVLDAMTYAATETSLAAVRQGIDVVVADICDLEAVRQALLEHEIEVLVNFAAESHNSFAVLDPTRFFQTNVMGTQTLLEAARSVKLERFHHVSTCEVYGDLPLDSDASFTEESPYRPRTPYNASKASADHAVRSYVETFHLEATITNCCNNYGPYQFPEKLIPLFTVNALDDKPLPLYASKENRREWLHVKDHCRAIEMVLERGRPGETYNVGSGVEASIEQIADAVLDALGKPRSLKQIVPDRPGHDRRYLLSSAKIAEQLGWAPEVDFERGLVETIRWYAENRGWWTPLIGRSPVTETAWREVGTGAPAAGSPGR